VAHRFRDRFNLLDEGQFAGLQKAFLIIADFLRVVGDQLPFFRVEVLTFSVMAPSAAGLPLRQLASIGLRHVDLFGSADPIPDAAEARNHW